MSTAWLNSFHDSFELLLDLTMESPTARAWWHENRDQLHKALSLAEFDCDQRARERFMPANWNIRASVGAECNIMHQFSCPSHVIFELCECSSGQSLLSFVIFSYDGFRTTSTTRVSTNPVMNSTASNFATATPSIPLDKET